MNKITHTFLYVISILILFASCNSGNKVVSSFGKRKYTKGFYLNVPGTVKSAYKPTAIANNDVRKKNNLSLALVSKNNSTNLQVLNVKGPSKNTVLAENKKVAFSTPVYQNQHIQLNDDISYGVPDHHPSLQTDSRYDVDAKTGNILGIVSMVLIFIFPPAGLVCAIIGLIESISGLKSEQFHRKAQWGLGLSIAAIVLCVLAVVLLYILLVSGLM